MNEETTPETEPRTSDNGFRLDLNALQRNYKQGQRAAAYEALRLCQDNPDCQQQTDTFDDDGVLIPQWVADALNEITLDYLLNHYSVGRGRNAKWASRYRQDMMDYARYEAVQHILENRTSGPGKDHKVNWDSVRDWASEYLKGTPNAGAPDTIRRSYRRYQRSSREDPSRYYSYGFMYGRINRVKND